MVGCLYTAFLSCVFSTWLDRSQNHIRKKFVTKHLAKHGLRLDVPISYLDVGLSSPLPVLKPSDFLKLVDETRSWDKLCGQADLTVAESMFELFWSRYEQLYPNFWYFQSGTPQTS